jgi:hypothetical protein
VLNLCFAVAVLIMRILSLHFLFLSLCCNNILFVLGKNSESDACEIMKSYFESTDEIDRMRNEWQRIMPVFIKKELERINPAVPDKVQEYHDHQRHVRFNILGPVGPACKSGKNSFDCFDCFDCFDLSVFHFIDYPSVFISACFLFR